VADGAIGREAGSNVRRVGCSVVVCPVAADTCGGNIRAEVIVGVAACAWHCYVRAGQRERSVVVVKRRCCPRRRVVALGAIGWEAA